MKESLLTERINKKLIEHGIPRPFRELRLCLPEGRQFRADYCWLTHNPFSKWQVIPQMKYKLRSYEDVKGLIESFESWETLPWNYYKKEIKGKLSIPKITALATKEETLLGEYLNFHSLEGSPTMNGVVLEADGKPFGGRHTRGAGFIQDSEKKNMISAKGFIVLNTTGKDLDGLMEIIKKCLVRVGI